MFTSSRDEYLNSVRDRLNELRGGRAYSDLAQGFSASSESVRRWLTGGGSIPIDFVSHMSRRFGVNANWILFGLLPRHGICLEDQIQNTLRETKTLDRVSEAIKIALIGNPVESKDSRQT